MASGGSAALCMPSPATLRKNRRGDEDDDDPCRSTRHPPPNTTARDSIKVKNGVGIVGQVGGRDGDDV